MEFGKGGEFGKMRFGIERNLISLQPFVGTGVSWKNLQVFCGVGGTSL